MKINKSPFEEAIKLKQLRIAKIDEVIVCAEVSEEKKKSLSDEKNLLLKEIGDIEKKQEDTKKFKKTLSDAYNNLPYVLYMKENNISDHDLTPEIKKKISGLLFFIRLQNGAKVKAYQKGKELKVSPETEQKCKSSNDEIIEMIKNMNTTTNNDTSGKDEAGKTAVVKPTVPITNNEESQEEENEDAGGDDNDNIEYERQVRRQLPIKHNIIKSDDEDESNLSYFEKRRRGLKSGKWGW